MKKTQKFLILSAIIIASLGFTTTTIYRYSSFRVEALAHHSAMFATNDGYPFELPSTVNLAELLFANIHANGCEMAGLSTSLEYKNGWRKIMIEHPEYLYGGLKFFGKNFILTYKSDIEKFYEGLKNPNAEWRIRCREGSFWHDSITFSKQIDSFSMKEYWKQQRAIFTQYRNLTKKLLLLDDKKLNEFVRLSSQYKDLRAVKPLHEWLFKEKLISRIPTSNQDAFDSNIWYAWFYPCDILFLSYRVHRDFPVWTPRLFFNNVDVFSVEAEKYLPQ